MPGKSRQSANLVSVDRVTVNPTSRNVGIGSTIPVSFFEVSGNARVTGILTVGINSSILISGSSGTITAAAFVGDGSGLVNLPIGSQWVTTSAGIHTSSNVGIGTTNPVSKLQVSGNVTVSGITSTGGLISTSPITLSQAPFFRNTPTISTDYTITTDYNEMSIGPITINNGVTVTVNSGATWAII
jgi:hypothetical protein